MAHTGILVPLFSASSSASWGIGELSDIAPLSDFIAACGGDRLMILPIGTMATGETSPYSACSAMAIDPLYIGVESMTDFARGGGLAALAGGPVLDLAEARASSKVAYAAVRSAKHAAFTLAFDTFVRHEWEPQTGRGAAFEGFIKREGWWLDDYALFQAASETYPDGDWRTWPAGLRDREPQALDEARRQLGRQILRHQYLQWIAGEQWQAARAAAEARGVAVFGDLPFVVNLHSADVWARADEFLLDVSVGVPPDAFSATGQDWGLPAYRWDVIASRDYPWIRQRARRMASLFSGFRVDHLIGFFRTYGRPANGEPMFSPPSEPEQIQQGEAILRIFLGSGTAIIAEDLGTAPDFMRASMARLGVPGCKVLRWEREWHAPGQPFVDPAQYPETSCALTGTHDTDTLADWWDHADRDERAAVLQLPILQQRGLVDPAQAWNAHLRDGLLELAATASSEELFVAVQDVFGWRDRINLPGTVGAYNWTWRLPWPVDQLAHESEAAARAAFCQALALRRRQM